MSVKCSGPTHDSAAFAVSIYAERLLQGDLPLEYWIAADDVHVPDETVITRLSASQSKPGSPEETFYFFQSSHRLHAKQSFGVMTAGWTTVWRPLRFLLSQSARVVELATYLHKFCVDNSENFSEIMIPERNFAEIQ